MSDPKQSPKQSPLSADRLRAAFSRMLGGAPKTNAKTNANAPTEVSPGPDPCEINARSIVEAMLFVGKPNGGPLTTREMAAAMRGVSSREAEAAIEELNTLYEQDGAPYEIVAQAEGFCLQLREEFGQIRENFYGEVRQAKLSPAAIEVLSIVAYHQPATLEKVNTIRDTNSGKLLASLVRRQLIRIERPDDQPRKALYFTTDRFLRLMGIASLDDLPRNEDLTAA